MCQVLIMSKLQSFVNLYQDLNRTAMKAIIIDDEKRARSLLSNILAAWCPQVTAVLEAANLQEGVALIREKRPQIVFLDVEMPQQLGVEIFDYFDRDEINFDIAFTNGLTGTASGRSSKHSTIPYETKGSRKSACRSAMASCLWSWTPSCIWRPTGAIPRCIPAPTEAGSYRNPYDFLISCCSHNTISTVPTDPTLSTSAS